MAAGSKRSAVIAGIGSHLPPRAVTNEELAATLDTSDEWIRSRTGIATRRWADPGVTTSDLAALAGRRALECAGSESVGAVILATTTPDRRCPATAPTVAAKLGLAGTAAYDVAAVCSGFIYALANAKGLIAAEVTDRVLVVAAEIYSGIVDPKDRTNAVVFGDAAAAMVIRAGEPGEPGEIGPFDLGSDGDNRDLITVRAGGAEHPEPGDPADRYFSMAGASVFQLAVRHMAQAAGNVMRLAKLSVADIDHLVGHQANIRILGRVAEALDIPGDRHLSNISEVGNTAGASIPLALDFGYRQGRLRPGQRVLATAFGGGLTWGATTFTWPELPAITSTARSTS